MKYSRLTFFFAFINIIFILLILVLNIPLLLDGSYDKSFINTLLYVRVFAILIAISSSIVYGCIGLYLQTIFQNNLASPFTLGITPFISLLITFFIFISNFIDSYFNKILQNQIFNYLIIILLSLFFIYIYIILINKYSKKVQNKTNIILVGIFVGMFCSTIQQFIESKLNNIDLKSNFYWNLGSYDVINIYVVIICLITAFILFFLFFRMYKTMNIIQLGDVYSTNLSINFNKTINKVLIISSISMIIITPITGPIAFIGLISPLLAKEFTNTLNHKYLLIITSFIAITISLLSLTILKYNLFGSGSTINIIISIVFSPIVLYFLLKRTNNL